MSMFDKDNPFNNTHCKHCLDEINNSYGVCMTCAIFFGAETCSTTERDPLYYENERKETGRAKREIRGMDKNKRIKSFFEEIMRFGVIRTSSGPKLTRDEKSGWSSRAILNRRSEIERKLKKYMLMPGDVYFILLRIMNIKLRKRKRFNYSGITFYYVDNKICLYKINEGNKRIKKYYLHSWDPESEEDRTPENGPVFSYNDYLKVTFDWYINPEHLEELHFEDYNFKADDITDSESLTIELEEMLANLLEKIEDAYWDEQYSLTGYDLAMFLGCDDEYYEGMSDDTMWDITGH